MALERYPASVSPSGNPLARSTDATPSQRRNPPASRKSSSASPAKPLTTPRTRVSSVSSLPLFLPWLTKPLELPEKVLVFHAGTTRITFLALIKVTSLLIGAFFIGIVTPTYVRSDKPLSDTAQVLLCGLMPPVFVAFVTAPFVTHVHVHLPAQARASKTHLERFVRSGMFPSTHVSLTTMSFIAKPRSTTIPAGDLIPTSRRFGIVNYVRRDGTALEEERQRRKWYMFKPVTNFYVQEGRPGEVRQVRYQAKKVDRVQWWIWETIKEKLAARGIATD